jgi:putative peptidoglycan lipid II flippase
VSPAVTRSRRGALAGGLLGGAALVAAITLAARAVGFGRWLVFSGTVHADCVGTAYATANQLPNVLYEVVAGGALTAAVVPLLAGPLARGDRAAVARTASALLTWAVTLLLPAALLLAVAAGPLAQLMLRGQEGCSGQAALTARMLLVFAPQVLLYGVGVVLSGVLQAHRRFLWPAAAPLLSSLVVIAAYLGFAGLAGGAQDDAAALPASAEAVLAWGTTAGVAVLTLPLLLPVLAGGTRLAPTWTFPPGVARRALALAGAGILALLAQQAAVVVTMLLANGAGGTGAWPIFQYVQAVYLLPYAVLAVPLATVAFPRLAHHAATGDAGRFAATAASTTRAVLLVSLAGAAALAAAAPAVTEVFSGLDSADVSVMTPALAVMAPGLLGFALIAHVGRALNALHRARAAAVATSAGWVTVAVASAVAVALLASPRGTVIALAAGSSVGMLLAGGCLLVTLARVAGAASVAGLVRTVAVGVLAGALASAVGRLVADRLLAGHGTVGWAVLAGAAAAVVALAGLACGVLLGDRATARQTADLLRRRKAAA